jgi:hypothetical protein
VNSAKLFSENNQTKTRAPERMPPLRVCLARPNERPALIAVRAHRARVDWREFRAKIQDQRGVIDPCDDRHQRAGGPVSRTWSRHPKTPQGCSNITAALVRHDNQL